jgi:hypothetical protein
MTSIDRRSTCSHACSAAVVSQSAPAGEVPSAHRVARHAANRRFARLDVWRVRQRRHATSRRLILVATVLSGFFLLLSAQSSGARRAVREARHSHIQRNPGNAQSSLCHAATRLTRESRRGERRRKRSRRCTLATTTCSSPRRSVAARCVLSDRNASLVQCRCVFIVCVFVCVCVCVCVC